MHDLYTLLKSTEPGLSFYRRQHYGSIFICFYTASSGKICIAKGIALRSFRVIEISQSKARVISVSFPS